MSDHDPVITSLGDENGIRLLDPIESVEFSLFADRPVDPQQVDPGSMPAPVPLDTAARVELGELRVPQLLEVHLRDADFGSIGTLTPSADEDVADERTLAAALPAGTVVEFSTTPMKLYAVPRVGFDVVARDQQLVFELAEPGEVVVGVRSLHRQPAATIEVTEDPEDVMAALSHFGSALKTHSPERSFGTLRGHPPRIAVGDSFSVPDHLERADAGVEIEVPPSLDAVLPVASLAYYLGAAVVPGGSPRLLAGGMDYDLGTAAGPDGGTFEETVNDVLRRVFVMDCIVRTEGLYPVELNAREELENRLTFVPDFESLYETPLAERVAEYLSPRFDAIEDVLPDWHLVTDVAPDERSVRMLPYVADELSLVRCGTRREPFEFKQTPDELTSFMRGAADTAAGADGTTRGGATACGQSRGGGDGTVEEELFTPVETDAQCLQWVGDGYPVGATKAVVDSYERRGERKAATTDDYQISVRLVCNDPSMSAELVPDHYGSRDLLEFDVEVHEQVTADELRELLQRPCDFLHYIGHTTPEGIECAGDTVLDVRTMDDVAVDSFFLNSCRSYEQGRALVEHGSGAGCVTLSDVDNSIATQTGHQFAKLLNRGFSFRNALSVLRDEATFSQQYTVIGDGGLQLMQAEGSVNHLISLTSLPNDDVINLSMDFYPTTRRRIGSLMSQATSEIPHHYLDLMSIESKITPVSTAQEFLDLEEAPVNYNGSLHWISEIDLVEREE